MAKATKSQSPMASPSGGRNPDIDICSFPTELGRGSQGFPNGMSLNDLKQLYGKTEDRRPRFELVLGNGTCEDVTLDEYLKAELLPRHQMVLAYWLAGRRPLRMSSFPSPDRIKGRIYYPGSPPKRNPKSDAVQLIYDGELDAYSDRPDLEFVMAVLWRDYGTARMGGFSDDEGPASGDLGCRYEMYTAMGSISAMSRHFDLKALEEKLSRDQVEIEDRHSISVLRKSITRSKTAAKVADLQAKLASAVAGLNGILDPIYSQLQQTRDSLEALNGPVVNVLHCKGSESGNKDDVIVNCWDSRYATLPGARERARGPLPCRVPHPIREEYNRLRARFRDQRKLDVFLLENRDPLTNPHRNTLRDLNRRMYERRLCYPVVQPLRQAELRSQRRPATHH